ncbi:MAG: cytochrome B [Cellvibrio sp. 79]|nr:MAG: cytochrome B [Cellvibrio sp. 79]
MLKDSSTGYGLISILIHWISALLILFLFGLGVYMVDLTYYDDWYHKGPELHVSLGLLVLLIMAVRIVWRVINPIPIDLPAKPVQQKTAKLVKLALYLFIFVVIVSGYLITTAEGQAASMFNVIKFSVITQLSSANVDLAGEIHEYFAWAIIGLVVLHALGALFHHFAMRDRTLVRMFKPVKKSDI